MQAEDRVITLVALSETGGMQVLTPHAFLERFTADWQAELRFGLSFYLDAKGRSLGCEEAIQRLRGV